ncbi:alpha/beta hydrolase [Intrasporangium sp. YIM S08009]|uniref:alpha/beta fold hydrolase n=1 Tax=Intrasporangium zincisolvens TaxID=3080018 RepID=UPI002B05F565|nr:alpha/beta hydrolase [Intrasporangium sp. YIM S08009]
MSVEADSEGSPADPGAALVRDLPPVARPGGRSLALCEVGDPTGRPVVYFHGTGSSRLEAALYDEAARARGVRMLCWDRPGAGGSPAQPGRTMRDVVDDTRAVLDALGTGRVGVVGLSGGGSHVLVLAASAPDLVRHAVVVNAGPPAEPDVLALLPSSVSGPMRLARSRPRLFRGLAGLTQRRGTDVLGRVAEAVRRRGLDPTDAEVLERPEVRRVLEAAAEEGARQPGAWTDEALVVWGAPWGVGLDAFAVPLDVFVGTEDPFRRYGESLTRAGAQLHVFPGGHVSGCVPAVLDHVVSVAARG